ncbi:MAG TPA: 50S ribosomal protein L23 [Ruminiclostridium sp.]|jgi:large subunit ribosomal protein L23|nr:50S ribosomal protein L23 [Ruminiclostridium sp.]
MKHAEDILIRPYITEKSNMDIAEGKYTFIVAKKATKTEVKQAVEKLFGVKVVSVNTVNYDGKEKRQGVHVGKTEAFKKAVVKIDTDPKPVSYAEKGGKIVATSKKYKTSIEEFGVAQ